MLKETSTSHRFNVEDMEANERNSMYIAELGMSYGSAWSSLKKSWRQLKYCLKIGDFERVEMLKERISTVRWYMGLENEELY